MRVLTVKQGTPEWHKCRLGIPTASNFDRIITGTGKPSSQAGKYRARLCAEWLLGEPLDAVETPDMVRGTEMEPEAVRWYEFNQGVDCAEVGFCLRDDGRVGCSPDRLVGAEGLAEFKCPRAETHVGYLLTGMDDEYRLQTQGQLWVTGRKWVDLVSYHPVLPRTVVRIERDERFIAAIAAAVDQFIVTLDEAKAKLDPERYARDMYDRELGELALT